MTAAAFFLFGVVVGIAFTCVCIAWDRAPKSPGRVDRLLMAAEREQAVTRPTSSARKAPRGSL